MKKQRTKLTEWCEQEGAFGEALLSEWTGINEDGQEVSLENVTKGSHQRMLWSCNKCGNKWIVDIHSRTGYHTGCPFCSDRGRSKRTMKATTHTGLNDLLTWCNNHGEYGKHLLGEWLGQTKEGDYVDIHKIARGSNKEVLWRCSYCNESFLCPPSGRTGKNKRGCPNCNTRSTSYP